ncbi:hypothetical protein L3Q67_38990 [Saccharothrix sp. AJ9571]|nr:hypothetical protein L3Q67_38990 [Saccharothrix sp. AJ9571]
MTTHQDRAHLADVMGYFALRDGELRPTPEPVPAVRPSDRLDLDTGFSKNFDGIGYSVLCRGTAVT